MGIKFVPPSKEELAARGVGVTKPAPAQKQQKPAESKREQAKPKE